MPQFRTKMDLLSHLTTSIRICCHRKLYHVVRFNEYFNVVKFRTRHVVTDRVVKDFSTDAAVSQKNRHTFPFDNISIYLLVVKGITYGAFR